MELNNKDFSAIDAAAAEFFKEGYISQKCPRCGSELECEMTGNSYEIRCKKSGCISEFFAGV